MGTTTKIKPLRDRLIVKRLESDEKTSSGLFIPDSAKEKPQQGEVIAVGEGKITDDGKTIAPVIKTNDIVLFGKYSGQEIKIDGEDVLIMKEEDVYAIVEK